MGLGEDRELENPENGHRGIEHQGKRLLLNFLHRKFGSVKWM